MINCVKSFFKLRNTEHIDFCCQIFSINVIQLSYSKACLHKSILLYITECANQVPVLGIPAHVKASLELQLWTFTFKSAVLGRTYNVIVKQEK